MISDKSYFSQVHFRTLIFIHLIKIVHLLGRIVMLTIVVEFITEGTTEKA